jgi:hypothetical protein
LIVVTSPGARVCPFGSTIPDTVVGASGVGRGILNVRLEITITEP